MCVIHRVEHECVARRNPLWSRFCLRSGGRRLARGGLARGRSRAGVTRGQERRSRRDRSIVGWGFIRERGLVGTLDGKRRCHRPTVCRWGFAAGRARRGRSSNQAEPAAARKRFGHRRPRGRFGCRLTSGRSRIRRSRRIGAPRRCARPCVRSRRTAVAAGRPGRARGPQRRRPPASSPRARPVTVREPSNACLVPGCRRSPTGDGARGGAVPWGTSARLDARHWAATSRSLAATWHDACAIGDCARFRRLDGLAWAALSGASPASKGPSRPSSRSQSARRSRAAPCSPRPHKRI